MNKLVSNVYAFIYFQVTQLIYNCKEIKFSPCFSFLLLDSSGCEKQKCGYNCIATCTEFRKVKELNCRMYHSIPADSQKFW